MSRSFEFPRVISLLRRFLLLAHLALSGCASTPPPQPSSAQPAEGTTLARHPEIHGRDHPGQSRFHLLGAREDAF
ncbi:phospholipase D family protein, partial [Pseudomonas aeruginosa]